MASKELCENCRFWREFILPDNNAFGNCRRYPPTASNQPKQGMLPITVHSDWCGEWQPIDAKTIKTDPVALVKNLDADAIRNRIDAIDGEKEALRILLRAALSKGT